MIQDGTREGRRADSEHTSVDTPSFTFIIYFSILIILKTIYFSLFVLLINKPAKTATCLISRWLHHFPVEMDANVWNAEEVS
jgi:hypothetical protein